MENRIPNDAFEQALRQSLDGFEVPYNSADWAQMERALDKSAAKQGRWSVGLLALLFGGSVALSTTLYYMVTGAGAGEVAVAQPAAALSIDENAPLQPDITMEAPGSEAQAPLESVKLDSPRSPSTAGELRSETHRPSSEPEEPAMAALLTPAALGANAPASNEVSIKPSITEGCPGTSVEFEVTNLPAPGTQMLWNFGDGSFSTGPNPKHAYHKAGRYEVTLSMSSGTGGTIFNKPVSDVIVIHERPEAAFNPMPQEYLDRVPSVHFENKSLKGTTYFWDFGDGQSSSLQVPTHVYKNRGDYTVSLVVTNAIGCTDRTERMVRIKEDYNLLAAPAFSPNGDGVEETFIPEALKNLNRRFRMTVHDPTTGALVYETSDVKRPWNGRVNGTGAPCTSGDYVWMVEMKDGEALGGTYNGTVSLLR